MTDQDLSQKVLQKIEKEKIKPKSKNEFLIKDFGIWAVLFAVLLIGGLACSVIIYMIDNNDWDLSEQLSESFLSFIFASLPYFWLIIMLVLVILIYAYFRRIKSGYRYHGYTILLAIVLISLMLGFIFYHIGFAQTLDNVFFNKIPLYKAMSDYGDKYLMQPERGILTGYLIEFIDEDIFILDDIYGRRWIVANKAKLPHQFPPGLRLILLGEYFGGDNFQAQIVRPILCRKENCLKMNKIQNFLNERNIIQLRISN